MSTYICNPKSPYRYLESRKLNPKGGPVNNPRTITVGYKVQKGDTLSKIAEKSLFICTLELIPKQNPYLLKIGDTLNIKVLMENNPLENTLIIAFTKQNPQVKQNIRTDNQGNAKIILSSTGTWIIKTVAMIPSDKALYDWESYWASLTFELR